MKSTTFILALIPLLAAVGCADVQQATYSTPDDAVNALITAGRARDKAALRKIFGPDSEKLLSSGDAVADRNTAEKFLAAYDEKHNLAPGENGKMTLVVGKDWPFPIPLVKDAQKGTWHFDTAAGQEEILNRRIGRNERNVINVCGAVVDAQREYAIRDPNGDGVPEYAEKFLSDPGKKNGLFWETAEGEPPSPLGPLVGNAVAEGYTHGTDGEPKPYHGYFYRILTSQGANAPGGAYDYLVGGKLIGGFALVAYPAEYGNSGIMTFMVSHSGTIYQRDLGENTAKLAKEINKFDPGPGWEKVEPAIATE
jgi:hypothetical protein